MADVLRFGAPANGIAVELAKQDDSSRIHFLPTNPDHVKLSIEGAQTVHFHFPLDAAAELAHELEQRAARLFGVAATLRVLGVRRST